MLSFKIRIKHKRCFQTLSIKFKTFWIQRNFKVHQIFLLSVSYIGSASITVLPQFKVKCNPNKNVNCSGVRKNHMDIDMKNINIFSVRNLKLGKWPWVKVMSQSNVSGRIYSLR